jgi:hypothetical protein
VHLLAQIQQNQLSALIIGGHAVICYGVPRATFDLDFLARKEQRHLWSQFMIAQGYSLFHESETFQQWSPPQSRIAVDLMLVDEETWNKMHSAAKAFSITEHTFLVAKPTHLIALKLHAMKYRPKALASKDWRDILDLIHTCKLNPAEESIRKLVERYASTETLKEYKAHFALHE